MREEISAAVIFLARLLEKSENFNQTQLEQFKIHLSELLIERFENHWFPDLPHKGQGYRCIRVNELDRRDASLEKAASACGIKYEDMKLPVELTIWVDPNEVCCRFGENKGSYCTLASFNDKENIIEVSDEVKELLVGELKDVAPKETTESPVIIEEALKEDSKVELKDIKTAKSPSTTDDSKSKKEAVQVTPLATNNSRQSNVGGRKHPHGSPKQKSGLRRGGFPPHHPPMQNWYNVISPHWMSPSPPPYHPMMRRQAGAPLPHHSRYHWPNKSMLKV